MPSAQSRVVIDTIRPHVDDGRFAVKRSLGDTFRIETVLLCDGHDLLKGNLLYRFAGDSLWQKAALKPMDNDIWAAEFSVDRLGVYHYIVEASIDRFGSYVDQMKKRLQAKEAISNDLILLGELLARSLTQLDDNQKRVVKDCVKQIKKHVTNLEATTLIALLDRPELVRIMHEVQDESSTLYDKKLSLIVEPKIASFGAWYEFFPRSTSPRPQVHGTFDDAHPMLEYVASLGFDVVYLPPIHPIGTSFRKGKNGNTQTIPDDVGSPWAIGNIEGGHKSILPQLGDAKSFERFVKKASELGLQIAMDLAYQCAPDHPYVKEHEEWFKKNPDGSIQYAENPPKKYQDIVPFNFECEAKDALFEELKSVVLFWVKQGVRIFRVDNPHTKPFYFWQWLIESVKAKHPDVVFLAEAFTRPHIMAYLAKVGFSQSYTYFTWRNTKAELTEYLTQLTQTDIAQYLRPNFWPNTPDILAEALKNAERPSFIARFVLASTLCASYGVYGPAFELCENAPRDEESEEYLNSEKYELRRWDLKNPKSIAPIMGRVNRIRHEHVAMHSNTTLRFLDIDNDSLIAYCKTSPSQQDTLVVVVNLDPHHKKSGMLSLPLKSLGIAPNDTYQMHDLLSDTRHFWQGEKNQVEIDPLILPAYIFLLRRKARSEQEFEYYA